MRETLTTCGSLLGGRNRRKVFAFPDLHRVMRNIFAYISLGDATRIL
jgi:hypothetical protein